MNREELLIQEKQHYEALACEETVLKEESSSLAESDAAKLKDQEIKLTQDLDEKRKEERKKRLRNRRKKKNIWMQRKGSDRKMREMKLSGLTWKAVWMKWKRKWKISPLMSFLF